VPWSKADPKLRAWVEANRQVLELFKQGAEQSQASHVAGDPSTDVRINSLSELAPLDPDICRAVGQHMVRIGLLKHRSDRLFGVFIDLMATCFVCAGGGRTYI
jgi:hypothetical protein